MKLELPNNWQEIPLEQLLEFVTGGDWGKDESYSDIDYALAYCIRGSEIKKWENEKGVTASLRQIKKSSIKTRQLKEGDILVEISGGGPDQPVGRTVLIDKAALSFQPDIPKICTNFLRLIRPIQEVDSKFLNYYLKLFYASGDIVNYQGGSNNLRNLKFPDFIKIKIPIPHVEEQQLIVSKIEELFSELDKGVEQLKTAQQQLKIYRQSLLQVAFEGKLTNKYLEEGKLPKGWKWYDLGEVIEKPQYGTSKKCSYDNSGKGVLRIPNINKGFIDSSDLKFAKFSKEEIQNYELKEGDILTIRSNGSVSLVGSCALIRKKDTDFLYAGYLIRLRPKQEKISPSYLSHLMASSLLRTQIESKAKSTSGVNNINATELSALRIPVAPLSEQEKIIELIDSKISTFEKMMEIINLNLLQCESLRQSILRQAFEGKLVIWEGQKQEAKVIPLYKPKNEYFYQLQVLAFITKASKQNKVPHGEMTLAKYAYLTEKLFDVPTFYDFQRWHLGPFPPIIKKVFNNKLYFKKVSGELEVLNEKKLFKTPNPYQQQIENAVTELTSIFSKYEGKERSHKTELLATICKVVEDIQTVDLKAVRASMGDWKIELKGEKHKTKAEKFSETETKKCLAFLKEKRWDNKLISGQ